MIRDAKIGDIAQISELIVLNWKDAYKNLVNNDFLDAISIDKFISIFTNNINNKSEKILIYEKNNEVIGFCSGKIINDKYDAQIIGLYIKQSYHGKGIGSELLYAMKNYFVKNKCKSIIIWTLRGAKNNSFYSKHGGVINEIRDLEIGKKQYPGIGFYFDLTQLVQPLTLEK